VKAFALSFTMDEENDLMIDHFEKLEPGLENFDFPESTLWIKKVDKSAVDQATHTNKLIAEFTAGTLSLLL